MPRVRHSIVARLGSDRSYPGEGGFQPADLLDRYENLIESMGELVQPNLPDGCWGWAGQIDSHGYSRFGSHKVHLVLHQILRGWPAGLGWVGHHMCQVKHCVNPHHIEMLTSSQHTAIHANNRGAIGWLSYHGTPRPDPVTRP